MKRSMGRAIKILLSLFVGAWAVSSSAQTWELVTNGWTGMFMFSWPLTEAAPDLGISQSNDTVLVSWPLAGSNCVLETSTDLPAAGSWEIAAAPTNLLGDAVVATLPATNEQQFFRLAGLQDCAIPVSQFAVFFDGVLEFSTAPYMTLNGRVHANGAIHTGSSVPQTFNYTVSTAADISSPGYDAANSGAVFNGNPPTLTNSPALRLPIETNNWHVILELPPPGEDPESALGRQRLCNQAQVSLVVSDSLATLKIQSAPATDSVPGADSAPVVLSYSLAGAPTNLPFLTLTNRFIDRREASKTNIVTQINLQKYRDWIGTNNLVLAKFPAGGYPAILFAADNRTVTSKQMTSVRIVGGTNLPVNGGLGFTLATPNPLYVWGNYNCTNASHLRTTNTTSSVPAALLADAVTVLSPNWADSRSGSVVSTRTAMDATINALIIAGNVPSTGNYATNTDFANGTFSGGIQNFVRLLEDWSGKTLTLNASLVCLYPSASATNQFTWPGTYFNAPTRQFSFDRRFLNSTNTPPGCPMVRLTIPGG
jgi:hypothetical protein